MNNGKPLAIAIMLNWNGESFGHLAYSLPSLLATKYDNVELVVVDNNSQDSSVVYISNRAPSVTLIQSGKNLGWSGGNNIGIRYALGRGARYIALVNNDMKFDSRWLEEGIKAAEADSLIGILGFDVFGEHIKDSEERFRQAKQAWNCLDVAPVDYYLSGCALLIKDEVFKNIGLIDEGYHFYAEDDDFEERARKAGYKIVRTNVPLWHHLEGSFGHYPVRASVLNLRNNVRFYIKNCSFSDFLRGIRRVSNMCLNPFFTRNSRRRIRGVPLYLSAGILVYAFIWNLFRLPQTLRARVIDNQKIADTKKILDMRI